MSKWKVYEYMRIDENKWDKTLIGTYDNAGEAYDRCNRGNYCAVIDAEECGIPLGTYEYKVKKVSKGGAGLC